MVFLCTSLRPGQSLSGPQASSVTQIICTSQFHHISHSCTICGHGTGHICTNISTLSPPLSYLMHLWPVFSFSWISSFPSLWIVLPKPLLYHKYIYIQLYKKPFFSFSIFYLCFRGYNLQLPLKTSSEETTQIFHILYVQGSRREHCLCCYQMIMLPVMPELRFLQQHVIDWIASTIGFISHSSCGWNTQD